MTSTRFADVDVTDVGRVDAQLPQTVHLDHVPTAPFAFHFLGGKIVGHCRSLAGRSFFGRSTDACRTGSIGLIGAADLTGDAGLTGRR